jgi:23S rRNA (guanine2445-N2)-methyltransferase
MFSFEKKNKYFAQIAHGMEEMGAQELKELGAKNIEIDYRGIYFKADRYTLYDINYRSRLISKILAPVSNFICNHKNDLYDKAVNIEWDRLIKRGNNFAIFANVSKSHITHSKYAALVLKDGIVDYFKSKHGRRPDVDSKDPDVWISLYINKNQATISVDSSGGSLHKRGYRKKSIIAPMQETLAAAIIKLTEWKGENPLIDPMCGSGTLLSEAIYSYCNTPASYLRSKFGFENFPNFDPEFLERVKDRGDENLRALPEGLVSGSDISKQAVASSIANLGNTPFADAIIIKNQDFNDISGIENSTIICNPPYGHRMGKDEDLEDFYRSFGDFLKQKCKGCTAYIYVGEKELVKYIGLRTTWKKPLKNADMDGRLIKIELY